MARSISALQALAGLTILACVGTQIWLLRETRALKAEIELIHPQLALASRELTRFRLEQRTEGRGINALIEKLSTYGPMLTSALIPKPEFEFCRKEMESILLAVESTGKDAYAPLMNRFLTLEPKEHFDELKWLMEAMVRADPEQGKAFVGKVLEGFHKDVRVTARLRLFAATVLTRIDKPLAGSLLRSIVGTESSRGINPNRNPGNALPDSANASSGFYEFIDRYVDTQDPLLEDTLIMVLGRSEHDLQTIQECVKALGALKATKAVEYIEKLYHNPPVISENPLFLNHCLQALVDIQGAAAKPFLEAELKKTENAIVANNIKYLLEHT